MYSIALIPWRLAYKQEAEGAWMHFDYFVDAVFGVDILLCFNSAYFEEVGASLCFFVFPSLNSHQYLALNSSGGGR